MLRLYCRGCKADLVGTLGAVEVLASAHLGSVLVPSGRTHALCLTDVSLVASSGPGDGSGP